MVFISYIYGFSNYFLDYQEEHNISCRTVTIILNPLFPILANITGAEYNIPVKKFVLCRSPFYAQKTCLRRRSYEYRLYHKYPY